ncbi:MAG: hypothetical protein NTX72_01205 [Candidatus Uhrbacteria bacterium]|nr:hypothetical protein [Candidatus Uhrbacteria bacterium]
MQVMYFLGNAMNVVIVGGLLVSAVVIPRDLLRGAFSRSAQRKA